MEQKDEEVFIPLHKEELVLGTEKIVTGVVTLKTRTESFQQEVDHLLRSESYEVERTKINTIVDTTPEIRTEGDIMIIPICEEVVVKRILIKEELRIKKLVSTNRIHEHVTLRKELAEITHKETPDGN